MCTLIIIHRRIPGTPLVVAANRDEFYDRPATGPGFLDHPNGSTILAPRDLRAGGTWLGLNQNGVFSALTNRPNPNPTPDPDRRSRGLLVVDALGFADAAKAAGSFESLDPDLYNPFNLLVADASDAFTVVCGAGRVRVERLEAGVHVIGNADPNDREHPKTRRTLIAAEMAVERLAERPGAQVLDGLGELCRSHDQSEGDESDPLKPLGATCVHHEGYGTRSSILLKLCEDPKENELYHADGAPCAHPYEDSTPLLHELSRLASYDGEGSIARKAS
jgi:uncharacterized protein with NRDE domain